MEQCFMSRKHLLSRYIFLLLALCEGIFLIILAILALRQDMDSLLVWMCTILIACGIIICLYGVFYYAVQSRDYTVDSCGITIRYLKKHTVTYSWDEISEISVCDVHHAPKDETLFDIVIRIVVGTEKRGPTSLNSRPITLSGFDHWRSFEYSLTHYRKVILLEYSESRLDQIKELSKISIVDYLTPNARNTL